MPDSLGELCKRAIERRGREEPTEWSEITVEPLYFVGTLDLRKPSSAVKTQYKDLLE
jgi:hypothetical protein